MSTPWDPTAYQRALRFAADAHGAQTLPGSTTTYVVHLANVAMEVMLAAVQDPSFDATLAVQVALLHDVLEDTSTPSVVLEERFGIDVLQLVRALTKDSTMPKADAMRDSLARIRQGRREAAIVKLADRITNLQPPPSHWPPEKRRAYLEEARQIRDALCGVQPWLEGRLSECISAYAGWIHDDPRSPEHRLEGGAAAPASGRKSAPCCGEVHPFDARHVAQEWWPERRRCLIVGESPGAPGGAYFYDSIPPGRDPITVRRHLLTGLAEAGVIHTATLEGLRGAGLAFDHAIRCPVSLDIIKQERQRARTYGSRLVEERGSHLRDLLSSWPKVWIMGHLARQAVTLADASLPRSKRGLIPPYVESPKCFVSAYFRRFDTVDSVRAVAETFRMFLQAAES